MSFFYNIYDILGVDRKANKEQIQEAYHAKGLAARKALISDKTGRVQQEIKQLDAAYRILFCEQTRVEYDKLFKKITWSYRLNKIRKIIYIPTPNETATAFLLLVAGLRFFQLA
jgi:curved DNA-binding protein CbpA